MSSIPSARIHVDDPFNESNVAAVIRAKAAELVAAGEPPTLQVWYPTTTAADFDVVTVRDDGSIETEPTYGA